MRLRPRNVRKVRDLQVGDMVLVPAVERPRGKWPLGRVLEVMPGSDGLLHEVKVRTATKELVSSIDRLCLLEGVTR